MKEPEKLKICMVVHQDYSIDGRVRAYSGYVKNIQAQMDVICVKGKKEIPSNSFSPVRLFTIPLRRFASGFMYFVEYVIAFIFYSIWLTVLYAVNRYDVIHVHNMPDFLIFAATIPRLFGAKLILDIHDAMPEFYISKFNGNEENFFVKILKIQERLSIKFSHQVITANENFKQNLINRGVPEEKITVLYNVPDPNIFINQHDKKKDGEFTLVYTGTIAARYGLETAVRALPSIVSAEPSVRLRLVGAVNEYAQMLQDLASELDVTEFIQFDGAVPLDEIPLIMSQSDVGIYPAISDAHMDIAVPTKVQEYAVMGLPIITTRLKVLGQIFPDDAVMYVEENNHQQFKDAVLAIMGDPAKRDKMTELALKSLKEVRDWSKERDKYLQILNNLFIK